MRSLIPFFIKGISIDFADKLIITVAGEEASDERRIDVQFQYARAGNHSKQFQISEIERR